MTRLVLHIGMPKTGSTAIQSTLEAQRARLRERGVVYPLTPGERGAQYAFMVRAVGLESSWEHARAVTPAHGAERTMALARNEGFERDLLAEMDGMHTLVVSSESLWGRPGIVAPVAAYASRLADEVTLVAYLRRQDLHVASAHGQMVKGGKRGAVPDLERASVASYLFHDRLCEWRAALPRARFVVRPYERAELVDGDVVADFAHHAGVPLDPAPDDPGPRPKRTNPSLDALAVSFLMRLNARLERGGAQRGRQLVRRALAARAEAGGSGAKVALGRERARAFLARYADQNAAVARDMGREDGVLFREPIGGPEADTLDALANDPNALDHAMDLVALVATHAHDELARLEATETMLRERLAEALAHNKRLAASNEARREHLRRTQARLDAARRMADGGERTPDRDTPD